MSSSPVRLVVYDISQGMARQFSALLGIPLDYIPHTGVLVHDREYFFGGGVQSMRHEHVVAQFGMAPIRNESLGVTNRTERELREFLVGIDARFTADTYDLFTNNCNHFSSVVAGFLLGDGGGGELLREIVTLPDRVMQTPMGRTLAPMWDQMQGRLMDRMVPFNNAPPPRVVANPVAALPKTTLVASLKAAEAQATTPKDLLFLHNTLTTITSKIIGFPLEDKFRRVNVTGERFKRFPALEACLISIGFVPVGDTYVELPRTEANWNILTMAQKVVVVARRKSIKSYAESLGVKSQTELYEKDSASNKLLDASDSVVLEVVQLMSFSG